MRPSAAQVERVAEALVRRLVSTQVVELSVGQDVLRTRVAAIFNHSMARIDLAAATGNIHDTVSNWR